MRARQLIFAVAAAVGALSFGASPAMAHDSATAVVYDNSGNRAGMAYVRGGHTVMYVCDQLADGIGVYGRMKLQNGTIQDISDTNGSAAGCAQGRTSSSNPIVSFQVVWRGGTASSWLNA
ncbi:hypothetical protein [Streptomyces griseoluteus]|uniref:hypothetical protein n=1 Tax=Streptomyces griseoluteus TaxID=29306 RepID=UPI0036F82773